MKFKPSTKSEMEKVHRIECLREAQRKHEFAIARGVMAEHGYLIYNPNNHVANDRQKGLHVENKLAWRGLSRVIETTFTPSKLPAPLPVTELEKERLLRFTAEGNVSRNEMKHIRASLDKLQSKKK